MSKKLEIYKWLPVPYHHHILFLALRFYKTQGETWKKAMIKHYQETKYSKWEPIEFPVSTHKLINGKLFI